MSSQSVLLIGASGYIGPHITKAFIAQKSKFARIAILADPSKVSKFTQEAEAGVEIVVGSFLESTLFKNFTTVICMLGNNALTLQPAIIEAAASAGVTHFYPSEFGGDLSQELCLKNPYFRDKLVTRQALEKTAEKYKGFGYTYIICGAFAEYLTGFTFGFIREESKFEFYGDVEKQMQFTGVADIAKYTVASVLTLPAPGTVCPPGRTLKIPTASHTWVEISDIMSRVTGRECKIIQHTTSDAYELVAKYAEEGDRAKSAEYALKAFIGDARAEGVPKPWDTDQFPEIKPQSLEVCLQRAFNSEI
ncbi:hypothetical protein BKA56DRAFT_476827 [Ilyonectria sp. MPI-CAGE-AT-0026]|nr:hypothetical protein BKA56DRAFT_476827 [Ilyonectria sp. MPI-CAGE-AT-0026]